MGSADVIDNHYESIWGFATRPIPNLVDSNRLKLFHFIFFPPNAVMLASNGSD